MILVLKHITIEGPGTIVPFFEKAGFKLTTIELGAGAVLPESTKDLQAVIVLGGPMNVYEEKKHPFLLKEDIFLKEIIAAGIPLLGICLGSQLIAKAAGAKVTKALQKEIGWGRVSLTEEGQKDSLFKGMTSPFDVFQWHEDTFEIPDSATHLAVSQACVHQAFRLGKKAYALQFHIEVTVEIIASWIEHYFEVDNATEHPQGKEMMDFYKSLSRPFHQTAETLYKNFIENILS